MDVSPRSDQPVTREDLNQLGLLAVREDSRNVSARPELAGLLSAACLTRGGAERYVTGVGVQANLDVWLLYRQQGSVSAPDRTVTNYDLGHDDTRNLAIARRVALTTTSVHVPAGTDASAAALVWLWGKTKFATQLRAQPVVLVWPERHCGELAWNPNPRARKRTA